jgi:hypothetical protein
MHFESGGKKMAFDGVKKFDWKKFFVTNLTGIVCALGLAALVSAVCEYNFFLMLLIFLAMYFVIGIALEYLIVALYIEKADNAMKKKRGEPTLPNRKAALKYAVACNLKVGNAADLVKKDGGVSSCKGSEEKSDTEVVDAEEKNKK